MSTKTVVYSSRPGSIVWTGGAVTTARLRSGETESADFSRISLYSWQMAHKWQKKWVTKSPHGASYKMKSQEMISPSEATKLDLRSCPTKFVIRDLSPQITLKLYNKLFINPTLGIWSLAWQYKNEEACILSCKATNCQLPIGLRCLWLRLRPNMSPNKYHIFGNHFL